MIRTVKEGLLLVAIFALLAVSWILANAFAALNWLGTGRWYSYQCRNCGSKYHTRTECFDCGSANFVEI